MYQCLRKRENIFTSFFKREKIILNVSITLCSLLYAPFYFGIFGNFFYALRLTHTVERVINESTPKFTISRDTRFMHGTRELT